MRDLFDEHEQRISGMMDGWRNRTLSVGAKIKANFLSAVKLNRAYPPSLVSAPALKTEQLQETKLIRQMVEARAAIATVPGIDRQLRDLNAWFNRQWASKSCELAFVEIETEDHWKTGDFIRITPRTWAMKAYVPTWLFEDYPNIRWIELAVDLLCREAKKGWPEDYQPMPMWWRKRPMVNVEDSSPYDSMGEGKSVRLRFRCQIQGRTDGPFPPEVDGGSSRLPDDWFQEFLPKKTIAPSYTRDILR